jgi:hypothetical protein
MLATTRTTKGLGNAVVYARFRDVLCGYWDQLAGTFVPVENSNCAFAMVESGDTDPGTSRYQSNIVTPTGSCLVEYVRSTDSVVLGDERVPVLTDVYAVVQATASNLVAARDDLHTALAAIVLCEGALNFDVGYDAGVALSRLSPASLNSNLYWKNARGETVLGSVAVDGAFVGCALYIASGTGAGQLRTVLGYASTDEVFFHAPWDVMPDENSEVQLLTGNSPLRASRIESGLVVAVNANAPWKDVTLDKDGSFANKLLRLTGGAAAGQMRLILGWNNDTRVAHISGSGLDVQPETSTTYEVLDIDTPAVAIPPALGSGPELLTVTVLGPGAAPVAAVKVSAYAAVGGALLGQGITDGNGVAVLAPGAGELQVAASAPGLMFSVAPVTVTPGVNGAATLIGSAASLPAATDPALCTLYMDLRAFGSAAAGVVGTLELAKIPQVFSATYQSGEVHSATSDGTGRLTWADVPRGARVIVRVPAYLIQKQGLVPATETAEVSALASI